MRWVIPLCLLMLPAIAHGERADQLTELSLEDLMKVEVTSVSKRSRQLSEAPAAVHVLTAEDIRRAGVTTLPEALRLVPGMQVAQIDGSHWAVSSRGFNQTFANKLLVMIDGRTIYNQLFSGVNWNMQDVVLEDIERIEVVRGPGGALWGSNAVNGVINIITRDARETQGSLISSGGGALENFIGTVRHGHSIGESFHWRGYGKFRTSQGNGSLEDPTDDGLQTVQVGFRTDSELSSRDQLTVQGDFLDGTSERTSLTGAAEEQDLRGVNVLARWNRELAQDSHVALQAYYDRAELEDPIARQSEDTLDLELQHRFSPIGRNDLVWGLGYRLSADDVGGSANFSVADSKRTDHLASLFVQDEISIVPERVRAIIGTKLEYHSETGLEVQPSIRGLWTPHERYTAWAAVSRAVRTPSRVEQGLRFVLPVSATTYTRFTGNPDFDSEELLAYELGLRGSPLDGVTLDLAAYYNDYDRLLSNEITGPPAPAPSPPFPPGSVIVPATFGNELTGHGYGVELYAAWQPFAIWRLRASYSWAQLRLRSRGGSTHQDPAAAEGELPEHTAMLQSLLDLPHEVELDTTLYYVDRLPRHGTPGYFRMDLRLGWRPLEWLELALLGRNLTDARHMEFGNSELQRASAVPRTFLGTARIDF